MFANRCQSQKGKKIIHVLHDCVKAQFKRLEGQSKQFGFRYSLEVAQYYQRLNEAKCGSRVEARAIGHLPKGQHGLRRGLSR